MLYLYNRCESSVQFPHHRFYMVCIQKYILYGAQRGSSKKFPTILAPVIFIHTMKLSNVKLESKKATLAPNVDVLRFCIKKHFRRKKWNLHRKLLLFPLKGSLKIRTIILKPNVGNYYTILNIISLQKK